MALVDVVVVAVVAVVDVDVDDDDVVFRLMVKWPGSLPSFLMMSGRRRRRAFMNQLHTWCTVRLARLDS